MTKIKGMDISNYQGKISVANFKKAKEAGIQFVILKIGYTGYEKYICKLDSAFENNYKNAKAAGLPVGGYYYSLGKSYAHGKEEAQFCIKHLKGKVFEWPIYIDMEDEKYRQKGASKTQLAETCNGFCDTMTAAGYRPGVYANTNWFNKRIGAIRADHTKWVAQYNKKCEYKGSYDIWQYSSSEGVPGISSKTDVNIAYKDLGKNTAKSTTNSISQQNKTVKLVAYNGTFPKIPKRGYFKRGDDSKQVKYLQLFLNWYGDYNLVIDTIVGSKTIKAVERFQKNQGLAVDGLFGKKCLKAAKAYRKKVEVKEEPKPAATTPTPAPAPIATATDTIAPVPQGYTGAFPTLKIVKTTSEVRGDTVSWAKMIAKDNRFHYGYTNKKKGINAHHNGCLFCGTQGSNKKGIVDKEYTYCCNPFVHAAYSHGGQVPEMLKICKKGSSYGFSTSEGYAKSKLFKSLGHPSYKDLKPGDVLCNSSHVAIYVGDNKLAEASGGDNNKRNSKKWNKSIAVKKMSTSKYKQFPRVYRYTGSVNTTKSMQYGDINKEIKKLQQFLNWYGNYNLTIDGKFMDQTLKAVKDFQTKLGLKSDGIVGEKTIATMKTVVKK